MGIERAHGHLRPEVAAADADVDDIGDAATIWSLTASASLWSCVT
jgi:hypothetical protein